MKLIHKLALAGAALAISATAASAQYYSPYASPYWTGPADSAQPAYRYEGRSLSRPRLNYNDTAYGHTSFDNGYTSPDSLQSRDIHNGG